MDVLEEYHKLILLVSNFVPEGTSRPMHIKNSTKISLGSLAKLFDMLDDGTEGILPIAHTVGAAINISPVSDDSIPSVIVI